GDPSYVMIFPAGVILLRPPRSAPRPVFSAARSGLPSESPEHAERNLQPRKTPKGTERERRKKPNRILVSVSVGVFRGSLFPLIRWRGDPGGCRVTNPAGEPNPPEFFSCRGNKP